MPARSGRNYLQGLREQDREVWLGGVRIRDVTAHAGLRRGAETIARLYDMQFDPELGSEMSFTPPEGGEPAGISFIIPRTREDLERRRGMMLHWARARGIALTEDVEMLQARPRTCAAAVRKIVGATRRHQSRPRWLGQGRPRGRGITGLHGTERSEVEEGWGYPRGRQRGDKPLPEQGAAPLKTVRPEGRPGLMPIDQIACRQMRSVRAQADRCRNVKLFA